MIIFVGCVGSQSAFQGNHVGIFFKDSTMNPYYLLSVRDSGLVVKQEYPERSLPQFISFSRIIRVMHGNSGKLAGGILGGLIGFGATAGAGAIYEVVHKQSADPNRELSVSLTIGFVILDGIILGSIIGYNTSDDDKAFYPEVRDDRDELRYFALFPDVEPPDVQKIK